MLRWLMSLGVLLYAGTGVVTMLLGGNLLDYDVLASNPLAGQHRRDGEFVLRVCE